jgi:hypothetical protein
MEVAVHPAAQEGDAMNRPTCQVACSVVLFATAFVIGNASARKPSRTAALPAHHEAGQDSEPETVLSTLRARAGNEAELQKALIEEWATLRRLGLVLTDPHVLLKGQDESGKTIFVEVLTWRDHDAPDHAPAEVEAIWKHLESLCEPRLGHRGIEFPEFEVVGD